MGAGGLLAAFSLLICLASGLMLFQGIQATLYRAERCNRAAAAVSLAAAVAALVCFAARMGHADRVFGMFANVTSPTTHLLYAAVLFVVVCLVYLVVSVRSEDGSVPRWCGVAAIMFANVTSPTTHLLYAAVLFVVVCLVYLVVSVRSEDGSVPRWCGVAAIVVSLAVAAFVAFGNYNYLHLTTLTPDFWALAAYCVLNALAFGALGQLVLGAVLGCDDATGFAAKAALPCVVLSAVGMAVVLGVFALDSQAASAATTSMFSMTKYNVKAASAVAASDTLAVVLSGASAPLFWGGAVAVGAVVPLVVSAMLFLGKGGKRPVALGAIALVCALVGAVCFRLCLGVIGI